MDMNELIKNLNFDTSSCLLMSSGSGKTTLIKALKKQKINTYSLEKSTIDIKEKIIEDEKKLPYLKGLIKKINQKTQIVIDDLSEIFNYEERTKIFSYLKKQNINVIYLTSDIEDILSFPYTIVTQNQKIIMEGQTDQIILEEKLMKLLGYSLPFYVNLSTQLKYYGLLDHICYTKEELERCLWK